MLLLIGESLGMQELLLIGVIALIIFGPRKLPQIARTIGKTMAEFRRATNEFKSTWEKEVDFENLEREEPTSNSIAKSKPVELPEVKTLDASDFGKAAITGTSPQAGDEPDATEEIDATVPANAPSASPIPRNEKRDWL